jgi:hypothetical protein
MQADTSDLAAPPASLSAVEPIRPCSPIAPRRSAKPVVLLQRDSHLLKIDRPAGQPDNLTRIVVQGSTNIPHEWPKLTVNPARPGVFSCQTVQFVSKTVTPCPAPLAP